MRRKRNGSAIVEAAMVLPIVILSIVALVYILMFMYNEVSASARAHVAANAQMGRETGVSVTKRHIPRNVSVTKGSGNIGSAWYASDSFRFKRSGLFRRSFNKQVTSGTYEVDEKKLIRYTDIFK